MSIMQLQSEKLNKVFNLMTNSLKRCQQQSCQRDREREFSQSCHRAASMFSVCSLFVGLSLLMGLFQCNTVQTALRSMQLCQSCHTQPEKLASFVCYIILYQLLAVYYKVELSAELPPYQLITGLLLYLAQSATASLSRVKLLS